MIFERLYDIIHTYYTGFGKHDYGYLPELQGNLFSIANLMINHRFFIL